MDSISNTVWQRKGSCVIFEKNSLGEFIASGAVISLRQLLGWMQNFPSVPPVPGKTILVSGLETVMESLSPEQAEDFLVHRIKNRKFTGMNKITQGLKLSKIYGNTIIRINKERRSYCS